ncbi:MAG: ribosome maturation factor RimM [Gammaproteobacteria bacterium]
MDKQQVVVGRISGLYGIKGWVKVFSFTEPRENILSYSPWQLSHGDEQMECAVADGRVHGKGLVAKIDGVDDRDIAARYVGAEIRVDRDRFDRESELEFYWVDLEGMQVETEDGQSLGEVGHLFATGANDVMVVEGERRRLIPFVLDEVVKRVDRESRTIRVDWDPDF